MNDSHDVQKASRSLRRNDSSERGDKLTANGRARSDGIQNCASGGILSMEKELIH